MANVEAAINVVVKGTSAVNQLLQNVGQLQGIVDRINATPLNIAKSRVQKDIDGYTSSLRGLEARINDISRGEDAISKKRENALKRLTDLQQKQNEEFDKAQRLRQGIGNRRLRPENQSKTYRDLAAGVKEAERAFDALSSQAANAKGEIRSLGEQLSASIQRTVSKRRSLTASLIDAEETIRPTRAIARLTDELLRYGDSLKMTRGESTALRTLTNQIKKYQEFQGELDGTTKRVGALRAELEALGAAETVKPVPLGRKGVKVAQENVERTQRNARREQLLAEINRQEPELARLERRVDELGPRILANQRVLETAQRVSTKQTGLNTSLNQLQAQAEALALVANNSQIASTQFNQFAVAAEATAIKLSRAQQRSFAALAAGFSSQAQRAPAGLGGQQAAGARSLVAQTIADIPSLTRSEAALTQHISLMNQLKSIVPLLSDEYTVLGDSIERLTNELQDAQRAGVERAAAGGMTGRTVVQQERARAQGPISLLPQFSVESEAKRLQFTEKINDAIEDQIKLVNKIEASSLRAADKEALRLQVYEALDVLEEAATQRAGQPVRINALEDSRDILKQVNDELLTRQRLNTQDQTAQGLTRRLEEARVRVENSINSELIDQVESRKLLANISEASLAIQDMQLKTAAALVTDIDRQRIAAERTLKTPQQVEKARASLLSRTLGIQAQINSLEGKGVDIANEKLGIETVIARLKEIQGQASQRELKQLEQQVSDSANAIKEAANIKAVGGFEAALPAEEIRKQRNKIISDLNSVVTGSDSAGDNVVSTFSDSLRSGASAAAAAASGFAEAAKRAIKKAFGIASPSRFIIELVQNLTNTYIAEMQKSYPRIQAATEKAFGQLRTERAVKTLTASNRGFEFLDTPSAGYKQLPIRAFESSGAGGEMDEMLRRFRNQIAALTTQPEIYRNLLNALPSSSITTDLIGAANRRATASEIPSFMSTQRMLGPGELERVIAKAAADYFRTVRTPDPWVGLVGDYKKNFVDKIISLTAPVKKQLALPAARIAGALPPSLFESGLRPEQEIRRMRAYQRSQERAAAVMAERPPQPLALPPARSPLSAPALPPSIQEVVAGMRQEAIYSDMGMPRQIQRSFDIGISPSVLSRFGGGGQSGLVSNPAGIFGVGRQPQIGGFGSAYPFFPAYNLATTSFPSEGPIAPKEKRNKRSDASAVLSDSIKEYRDAVDNFWNGQDSQFQALKKIVTSSARLSASRLARRLQQSKDLTPEQEFQRIAEEARAAIKAQAGTKKNLAASSQFASQIEQAFNSILDSAKELGIQISSKFAGKIDQIRNSITGINIPAMPSIAGAEMDLDERDRFISSSANKFASMTGNPLYYGQLLKQLSPDKITTSMAGIASDIATGTGSRKALETEIENAYESAFGRIPSFFEVLGKEAADRVQAAIKLVSGAGGGPGGRGPSGPSGRGGGPNDPSDPVNQTAEAMFRLGQISKLTNNNLEELEQKFTDLRNKADATGVEFKQLTDDLARINREQQRRDPNADILTSRFGPRMADAISEGLIGGAFPALFGQGLGASLGGLAGGGLGGFVGGNLGFGLSLLGTGLGSVFDRLNQAAQETGKSLNRPIENFEKLKEAGLFASREQEYYISKLIESGRTTEATTQIQAEMMRKIGVTGVNDLMRLGDASSDLSKAWAEFSLQLQAALAGPMAGLLEWITNVLKIQNESFKSEQLVRDVSAGLTGKERDRFLTEIALIDTRIARSPLLGGISLAEASKQRAALAESYKPLAKMPQVKQPKDTPEQREKTLRTQMENAEKIRALAKQGEELDRRAVEMRRNNEETIYDLRKRAADMEREAADYRRSLEEKLVDKRMEIERTIIENDRKRRQNQIEALDFQLEKAKSGMDPIADGIIDATRTYLRSRAEGEADLQQKERNMKLEIEKIERGTAQFKLEVEDRVRQMNEQRDAFSRDVAKTRLQIAEEEGRYLMDVEDYRLEQARRRVELALEEGRITQAAAIAAQEGLAVPVTGRNYANIGGFQGGRQMLHGIPGYAGFDPSHASETNIHYHFAGKNPAETKAVADYLKGLGYQITEFGQYGQRVGRHAPGSQHYREQGFNAFDIPGSSMGGPISEIINGQKRVHALIGDFLAARTTGAAPSDFRTRYLMRMSNLEGGYGVNGSAARNPKSNARGYFQLIPSKERDLRGRGMGRLADQMLSKNFQEAASAAYSYATWRHPAAKQLFAEGDVAGLDRLLNRLWTSLPGGKEEARGERLARGNQYLRGPSVVATGAAGVAPPAPILPPARPARPSMPGLPATPGRVGFQDLIAKSGQLDAQSISLLKEENGLTKEQNRLAQERAMFAYQEQVTSPIDRLRQQNQELQLEIDKREILNPLIAQGVDPALIQGREKIIELERTLNSILKGLNESSRIQTQDALAKYNINSDLVDSTFELTEATINDLVVKAAAIGKEKELRQELERILEVREKLKGAARGRAITIAGEIGATAAAAAETPQKKIKSRIDKTQEELNKMIKIDELAIRSADNISNAFGGAFRDIITGASSTEEALAGFFKNVADDFAAMAVEIIARQMLMITLQTILKALGLFSTIGATGPNPGGIPSTGNVTAPSVDSLGGFDVGSIANLAANGAYFADGVAAFANGGAFTNSIVSSPTLFQFADGGTMKMGEMGEAGPEAIMPLRRGPDGRLGVDASGLSVPFQRTSAGLQVPFMKDAAAAESAADGGPASIDVRFETVRIGDLDVVTHEEAQRIGREAAQRGAELAHKRYRNNPGARREVGWT